MKVRFTIEGEYEIPNDMLQKYYNTIVPAEAIEIDRQSYADSGVIELLESWPFTVKLGLVDDGNVKLSPSCKHPTFGDTIHCAEMSCTNYVGKHAERNYKEVLEHNADQIERMTREEAYNDLPEVVTDEKIAQAEAEAEDATWD